MIWRCYYRRDGDHVHCRLFVGPAEGALGQVGRLVFRHEEFTEFTAVHRVIAVDWVRETNPDGSPAGEDVVRFSPRR